MMLPDNTNATAGNGGESQNYKAAGLVSTLASRTDLTAEDRLAAFVAGYEQGKAERVEIEIEDRVLARLHDQARAALGMATAYAAKVGPSWAAMVTESGDRE